MKLIRPPKVSRTAGFTLIELLVAVVVAGILLAVALPSFMDSVRKGRRSEAFTAMAAVQQAQERHRSNNPAYASTLSTLGINGTTAPGAYYTLSLGGTSATAYTVSAVGTGSQADDGDCARLSLRVDGGAITYASCRTCTSFTTYTANDRCWAR